MFGTMLAMAALALAGGAAAGTPADQLARPPADATRLEIVSPSAHHGQTLRWTDATGVRWSRESIDLRGLVSEVDEAAVVARDGTLQGLTVRGVTPLGDAAESFTIAGGVASWRSPVDKGSRSHAGPALYIPFGGTFDALAIDFDALAAAPGHRLPLLPSGEARLEPLTTATIGTGAMRKTLTAWEVVGLSNAPQPVWADDKGRFFALIGFLSAVPTGYEADVATLEKAQDDAVAKRGPAVLAGLLQPDAGPVAFTHVEMFDAEAKTFRPDMTVVVEGGYIKSVGRASAAAPAGAKVIDGAGKTLIPGLWDMHQHYGDDSTGPLLLSLGITSARDPGNNNALTMDRADRRAHGLLLSPNVYPSSLIDGKSPYTAQVGTSVASLDEAIAAVDKAKQDGFVAIKLYGSFNPAWVEPTAAEAHRLGLHVHGHIPAGMRPWDAVKDGYDEVTHIYFVMMQAMPQAVVAKSNTAARFEGTGRYAAGVDLDAEPMKSFIADLAARHITVDATLALCEEMYVPEAGEMPAAYAPFVGTLPPATERQFLGQGIAVPADSSRARFRASFAKLEALVAALHKSGVRVVAGTDGSGLELVRELELYVDAGFTPAEALEAATLDPARVLGADRYMGSIAVGKVADLVLVEGDPSRRMGDLRNTRLVMLGGRLMDADALRAAAGFSGRPH
jgi:imidazolonepropionase-like amidohydrolase